MIDKQGIKSEKSDKVPTFKTQECALLGFFLQICNKLANPVTNNLAKQKNEAHNLHLIQIYIFVRFPTFRKTPDSAGMGQSVGPAFCNCIASLGNGNHRGPAASKKILNTGRNYSFHYQNNAGEKKIKKLKTAQT